MSTTGSYPLRQKSAKGEPKPTSRFERRCTTCGASFLGLAPGKTGESGIWNALSHWYCSVECTPKRLLDDLAEASR